MIGSESVESVDLQGSPSSDGQCLVPLREIFDDMISGVSVNGEDRPALPSEFGVLKVSCVKDGVFIPEENKAIVPGEIQRAHGQVATGDIIVSRANTPELVGSCGIVESEYPNLFLCDKTWKLQVRNKERDDPRYFAYVISSKDVRLEIANRATGTSKSMKNISKEAFLGIKVARPSLKEQKKASEILSCWDDAISKSTISIKVKQQFKNSILQKFFSEFSSNGEWKKVVDFLDERDERAVKSDSLPLYSLTIENGVTPKSDRYDREKLVKNKDGKKYKTVYPKDIVFNPANLRWGAIGLSKENSNVLVSPIYEVLRCKNPNLTDFIFQMLSSPRQIALFATMTEGTLIERMAVKVETFLDCDIPVPKGEDECVRVGGLLSLIDKEIEALMAFRMNLEKQKQALMQKLLTGKIRVKV
jgi:type I restriction enzyme S subunit